MNSLKTQLNHKLVIFNLELYTGYLNPLNDSLKIREKLQYPLSLNLNEKLCWNVEKQLEQEIEKLNETF